MVLTIYSQADLDVQMAAIEDATSRVVSAIGRAQSPTQTLKWMKFEKVGYHPVEGHALNVIEQINQTFTYLVALKATAWLLCRHPDARGFRLAPGATKALPLDIMSVEPNLVGAETFASVDPGNNKKLDKDLAKLKGFACQYRYAFFYAPGFSRGRIRHLERYSGIEVHCVDI